MATWTLGLHISPERNLSRYLQEIKKFPMLSAEEEARLAYSWRDHNDVEASHKLVTSHLRLVVKIAVGNGGYGLPLADLISEGNVGIMQAIKRFDPDKGFRLSTYAMWWIRASIQEYVLHSWSMVKMGTTAAQKKLFFNLRKIKNKIQAMEEGDLLPEHVTAIARQLKVPEEEVTNMNRRLFGHDHSLNTPVREEENGEWQDWLVDEGENQEEHLAKKEDRNHKRKILFGAIKGLSDRESKIFVERRLSENPLTLEKLSQHYGISRERVRQIEVKAFEKVQKSVKNTVINQRYAC